MNTSEHSWTARKGVIVAAATMSLVVALNGAISYRDIGLIVNNFEEARRDGNTRIDLDSVLSDLLNAEGGLRGYLLTGNRHSLDPFYSAARQIPVDLRHIDQLTLTEPGQQARLRTLRRLISQRLAQMQRIVNLYSASGARAAVADNNAPGSQLMDSIFGVIATMTAEEERQRVEARTKSDSSGRRAFKVVIISTAVAGVLLLLSFLQFGLAARAERVARRKAESAWEAESRAREDSETANRIKDQFIATVSHELRTPLTSILGWSAVLSADDDPQIIREGLMAIQLSASVQKRLIEDLLDVSRIQTGKLRLSMRTLDLSDVVHAAVESMKPAADAKSITVATDFERGIRISGDPDRLQQIVWNLMTNAVKFTPRGGAIEVHVYRDRSHSVIEVRDSGEGIDEAFAPHVFEPFRQSDASRAGVHKGLGLGLSIAKYLAEAHGGVISVSSPGEAQGTTFRVSLPIMPIVHAETIAEDSAAQIGGVNGCVNGSPIALPASDALANLEILVVDDHAATLDVLGFVLRKSGATVYPAGSAKEAFGLLCALHPDVVVSDIGMPDEDGLSFVARIRALDGRDGGRTPAIALTAYVRQDDCDQLLGSGFQAYVTKPIEPTELVNAITGVLRDPAP